MKTILKSLIVRATALLLSVAVAVVSVAAASIAAAPVAIAQDRVAFRQAELDQMLAPIALYPDPLLSQILMASTYPLEVVQAARWSRSRPGLRGQQAVQAAEAMDWDPSVKSLTAFPQILQMMDEKLEWTQGLGEAFLAQQADVMDSVQALRRRAEAAGNLKSNDRMRVSREEEAIYIEPAAPDVVYVPYYDPVVVYGPWWWPAYPPVYWGPPAGYYYAGPAHASPFIWGSGFVISAGFFFGRADWHQRRVLVVQKNVTHVVVNRQTTVINRSPATAGDRPVLWRHDPVHRRGAPYRTASLQKEFGRPGGPVRREINRQDPPAAVRRGDADRPANLRDGRPEDRGKARIGPENRSSTRPDRPAAQGNGRRPEQRLDTPRSQARSADPQPRIAPPVTRPDPPPNAANSGNRPRPTVRPEPNRPAENPGYRAQNRGSPPAPVARPAPLAVRPPAATGNFAARAVNGNQRGDGEAKSNGKGARRQGPAGREAQRER